MLTVTQLIEHLQKLEEIGAGDCLVTVEQERQRVTDLMPVFSVGTVEVVRADKYCFRTPVNTLDKPEEPRIKVVRIA